jgi:hypothetical protein
MGLARELRGLVAAASNRSTYILLFDTLHPPVTQVFLRAIVIWAHDLALTQSVCASLHMAIFLHCGKANKMCAVYFWRIVRHSVPKDRLRCFLTISDYPEPGKNIFRPMEKIDDSNRPLPRVHSGHRCSSSCSSLCRTRTRG